MENGLLSEIESKISIAYAKLGHDQGWSFLYTPGRTLTLNSRFLFMGLNPGGESGSNSAELTTEKGNAYNPEVEDWGRNGDGNPLQRQVVEFYKLLSSRIGHDYRTLMDSTLAANFCPFRSKSWADLGEQAKTISFCEELWTNLLLNTEITTIVCMSSLVYNSVSAILVKIGGRKVDSEEHAVGWGKVKYYVTRFKMDQRDILMVCLPHLSRYQIFDRDGSRTQTEKIADMVAGSLQGWCP
jgi:hypothetical protein